MDIERAVEDFVHTGKDLFRRLRSEGESLSNLGLGILRTQLHIFSIEAARLKSKQLIAEKTNGAQCTVQVDDACMHRRAIDSYIDESGNRTKLFYCLECGTVLEAPPVPSEM